MYILIVLTRPSPSSALSGSKFAYQNLSETMQLCSVVLQTSSVFTFHSISSIDLQDYVRVDDSIASGQIINRRLQYTLVLQLRG